MLLLQVILDPILRNALPKSTQNHLHSQVCYSWWEVGSIAKSKKWSLPCLSYLHHFSCIPLKSHSSSPSHSHALFYGNMFSGKWTLCIPMWNEGLELPQTGWICFLFWPPKNKNLCLQLKEHETSSGRQNYLCKCQGAFPGRGPFIQLMGKGAPELQDRLTLWTTHSIHTSYLVHEMHNERDFLFLWANDFYASIHTSKDKV